MEQIETWLGLTLLVGALWFPLTRRVLKLWIVASVAFVWLLLLAEPDLD